MNHNYYYFSTHTTYPQIYDRLAAYAEYQKLDNETQTLLDKFVNNFTRSKRQFNSLNYCSTFYSIHKDELYELDNL